jgi:hypothetical protein
MSRVEAQQREQEMQQTDYFSENSLHTIERQLQVLIDKLRIQNPQFAEAVSLLNSKFNTLKQMDIERKLTSKHKVNIRRVNISACGISFDEEEPIDIGRKLYLDLTLLPTDIHVFTLGDVIGCQESKSNKLDWTIRVDFYGMSREDEELMVQHIVKRQGRLLAARRSR